MTNNDDVRVKILPTNKDIGRLADVELHFKTGLLGGLKLVGFSLWKTLNGLTIQYPLRQYNVNGERCTFCLLRPNHDLTQTPGDALTAQLNIKNLILDAWHLHNGER